MCRSVIMGINWRRSLINSKQGVALSEPTMVQRSHRRARSIWWGNLVSCATDYKCSFHLLIWFLFFRKISFSNGEDLLLLDNSSPVSWKVRNGKNEEAEVPPVILLIPGPSKDAIDVATKYVKPCLNLFRKNVVSSPQTQCQVSAHGNICKKMIIFNSVNCYYSHYAFPCISVYCIIWFVQ